MMKPNKPRTGPQIAGVPDIDWDKLEDFYKNREEVGPENKYQNDLQLRWQRFIQQIRVHEMLKCLKSEHQKLKFVREHTDVDEILQTRFDELGGQKRKLEEDEDPFEILNLREEEEPWSGGPLTTPYSADDARLEAQQELDREEKRTDDLELETSLLKKENDAMFVRTQNEEEEGVAEIYPNLKRILADPKYVAKAAVKMFRTRTNIAEEELDIILELCDDRVERQALRGAFDEKKDRENYLHNAGERRQMLYDFINSNFFVQFMLYTIIISIVGIFLLTFEKIYIRYAFPLQIMDACIIGVFVVEAVFKMIIYKWDYFKAPWNILDVVIIVVNLVELFTELITKTLALSADINANIWFKFLKSLRALRLLRVIKFLPNLQVIVTTVFQSMLSMGSIAVLMCLFIFVFAVLGRALFYEESPTHFGNIWFAFVTLFQLLTLDDWFELLGAVNDVETEEDASTSQYWIMFTYLFCYIVIEYFVFLNLFVAVLVDNFTLTLADTEVRKQKEALMYLEGLEKYDELVKENMENEEEDDYEDVLHNSEYVTPDNIELLVEDYFPVGRGSREAKLLENIFKDLAALDFERYMWKRRWSLLHTVMDRATEGKLHKWAIQEEDMLDDKTKAKLAKIHNDDLE